MKAGSLFISLLFLAVSSNAFSVGIYHNGEKINLPGKDCSQSDDLDFRHDRAQVSCYYNDKYYNVIYEENKNGSKLDKFLSASKSIINIRNVKKLSYASDIFSGIEHLRWETEFNNPNEVEIARSYYICSKSNCVYITSFDSKVFEKIVQLFSGDFLYNKQLKVIPSGDGNSGDKSPSSP